MVDGGDGGASPVNHHHHQQRAIDASDVPQDLAPTVAKSVRSYSQLEALIDSHPIQFTPAVILPILRSLLPIVVASLGLGVFVEVPIPQLAQGVAVEQLSRWLWMLERGGRWARWRPVLEMLYLLRGNTPVVLSDDSFSVFGSRAAFMSEREVIRQQQHLLLLATYLLLAVLTGPDAFDPADPPTLPDQRWGHKVYRTYTSMVAFVLAEWLWYGDHNRRLSHRRGFWLFRLPASAAYRRVDDLLAASPSDAAQWGAGAAVFDNKSSGWVRHDRLVVLGSEAMGEGNNMAFIQLLAYEGYGRRVLISTTESAPHDETRAVVMRVLGEHLGGMVWRDGSGWWNGPS
ncbi:unnamed protein product [Vitrella brassicaformis CCMP3155]|uniref:Uncharacterized protein n=1 Tax=Vitrella brassicaformis (strain CCMP3155) TaxID=1169540 RepID=A0A0G4GFH6_VITBC|nr:unnamed protein product [Vitrella brassicaformis CCMP3155]|eukprot:CEM28288.1 unnamed protein product [Vitrella brassicaformis CCMP3155]